MQSDQDDQLRLQDKIVEIQGKYQQENDSFDKILNWKEMYKAPLTTLPMYAKKEKLWYWVFFDT